MLLRVYTFYEAFWLRRLVARYGTKYMSSLVLMMILYVNGQGRRRESGGGKLFKEKCVIIPFLEHRY